MRRVVDHARCSPERSILLPEALTLFREVFTTPPLTPAQEELWNRGERIMRDLGVYDRRSEMDFVNGDED